jgi:hypothetical protein
MDTTSSQSSRTIQAKSINLRLMAKIRATIRARNLPQVRKKLPLRNNLLSAKQLLPNKLPPNKVEAKNLPAKKNLLGAKINPQHKMLTNTPLLLLSSRRTDSSLHILKYLLLSLY